MERENIAALIAERNRLQMNIQKVREAKKVIKEKNVSNEILAFGVSLNDMECICFAASKSKAKWIAVRGAREAGHLGKKEWPSSISAWRAKEYDYSLAKCHGNGPWIEDYVRRLSPIGI